MEKSSGAEKPMPGLRHKGKIQDSRCSSPNHCLVQSIVAIIKQGGQHKCRKKKEQGALTWP